MIAIAAATTLKTIAPTVKPLIEPSRQRRAAVTIQNAAKMIQKINCARKRCFGGPNQPAHMKMPSAKIHVASIGKM